MFGTSGNFPVSLFRQKEDSESFITVEVNAPPFVSQIVGFHRPGSIRILSTNDRVNEAKYQLSRGGWHSAYMKYMNPDEVHEMVPYMNMDGIHGGLYTPGLNFDFFLNNEEVYHFKNCLLISGQSIAV